MLSLVCDYKCGGIVDKRDTGEWGVVEKMEG